MTQSKLNSLFVVAMAIAVCVTTGIQSAGAAPPDVRLANVDFDASGYVTPAGMVPPSMYQGGVMPVGYLTGCDSPCDTLAGCDGIGGNCGGACGDEAGSGIFDGGLHRGKGICGGSGLLKRLTCGCGRCGLRALCLFCRGKGCSACQLIGRGHLLGALGCLRPYTDAGICAQRWYDLSAEAVFLSHSNGSLRGPLTSLGVAPLGDIVLGLGDSDSGGDLESGMRLSAALIFGAGGNIEATYMGGNEWNSRASASDPNAGLFSFISEFGTNPIGGFDDTDRSILQTVATESKFHSAELNYRRRIMGPYCRFQGSWLIGLRYVRFESGLQYSTLGENDNTVNANLPRFFSSDDLVRNNLFGPQAGFDMWWNMRPGVSLGLGSKLAWVQNDIDRRTLLTANSLPGPAGITSSDQDTTVMGDFELKMAYRLSHSWTFRTAYYALAADDIAFGTVDAQSIRDFVTGNPLSNQTEQTHSLVVQGVSVGAEYIW